MADPNPLVGYAFDGVARMSNLFSSSLFYTVQIYVVNLGVAVKKTLTDVVACWGLALHRWR